MTITINDKKIIKSRIGVNASQSKSIPGLSAAKKEIQIIHDKLTTIEAKIIAIEAKINE